MSIGTDDGEPVKPRSEIMRERLDKLRAATDARNEAIRPLKRLLRQAVEIRCEFAVDTTRTLQASSTGRATAASGRASAASLRPP